MVLSDDVRNGMGENKMQETYLHLDLQIWIWTGFSVQIQIQMLGKIWIWIWIGYIHWDGNVFNIPSQDPKTPEIDATHRERSMLRILYRLEVSGWSFIFHGQAIACVGTSISSLKSKSKSYKIWIWTKT